MTASSRRFVDVSAPREEQVLPAPHCRFRSVGGASEGGGRDTRPSTLRTTRFPSVSFSSGSAVSLFEDAALAGDHCRIRLDILAMLSYVRLSAGTDMESTHITAHISQHAYQSARVSACISQHASRRTHIGARVSQHVYRGTRARARIPRRACHSTHITARISEHASRGTHDAVHHLCHRHRQRRQLQHHRHHRRP